MIVKKDRASPFELHDCFAYRSPVLGYRLRGVDNEGCVWNISIEDKMVAQLLRLTLKGT